MHIAKSQVLLTLISRVILTELCRICLVFLFLSGTGGNWEKLSCDWSNGYWQNIDLLTYKVKKYYFPVLVSWDCIYRHDPCWKFHFYSITPYVCVQSELTLHAVSSQGVVVEICTASPHHSLKFGMMHLGCSISASPSCMATALLKNSLAAADVRSSGAYHLSELGIRFFPGISWGKGHSLALKSQNQSVPWAWLMVM